MYRVTSWDFQVSINEELSIAGPSWLTSSLWLSSLLPFWVFLYLWVSSSASFPPWNPGAHLCNITKCQINQMKWIDRLASLIWLCHILPEQPYVSELLGHGIVDLVWGVPVVHLLSLGQGRLFKEFYYLHRLGICVAGHVSKDSGTQASHAKGIVWQSSHIQLILNRITACTHLHKMCNIRLPLKSV